MCIVYACHLIQIDSVYYVSGEMTTPHRLKHLHTRTPLVYNIMDETPRQTNDVEKHALWTKAKRSIDFRCCFLPIEMNAKRRQLLRSILTTFTQIVCLNGNLEFSVDFFL